MLQDVRRFLTEEEDGNIVEWSVLMLILLAFTVGVMLSIGPKVQDMLNGILNWINKVLGAVPSP